MILMPLLARISHQATGGVDRMALQRIQAVQAMMASAGGILVETAPGLQTARVKFYVAVSKEVKESKLTLVWALQHFGDKKICVASVLAPPEMIREQEQGAGIHVSSPTEAMMRAHRESERKKMHGILDEYLAICIQMGVEAEKELIESDSVGKGLVEFIRSRGVTKLVMGAAADERYFKEMTELMSTKAIYVKDESPSSCQIWFICSGLLIHIRKALPESAEISSSKYSPDAHVNDDYNDQLDQTPAQAVNTIQEALLEGRRRAKAEKESIQASIGEMVKAFAAVLKDEQKIRKEIEEELEKTKDQQDELMEALCIREKQIAEKDQRIRELVQRMAEEAELRQRRQQELDVALIEARELRSRLEDPWSATVPIFFTEFALSEIKEATRNFDPKKKIGHGGFGEVYKCSLRHVEVAIKKLGTESTQGPQEFEQEVKVLSKVRHPNLVTLIGACPKEYIIVYEYSSNGSLQDWLEHRDMDPLTCQDRVRIATELCSVLVFLHSSKPYKIVHGDVKPANILLDVHRVSKLSDCGTCCFLSSNERSSSDTTLLYKSRAAVTRAYMDPEFGSTGEITTKFDVYSFGIVLLQLLTRKAAKGIIKVVQDALGNKSLTELLDRSAGEWLPAQAEALARQALKCCEYHRQNRPTSLDVLAVLQSMRDSYK